MLVVGVKHFSISVATFLHPRSAISLQMLVEAGPWWWAKMARCVKCELQGLAMPIWCRAKWWSMQVTAVKTGFAVSQSSLLSVDPAWLQNAWNRILWIWPWQRTTPTMACWTRSMARIVWRIAWTRFTGWWRTSTMRRVTSSPRKDGVSWCSTWIISSRISKSPRLARNKKLENHWGSHHYKAVFWCFLHVFA